MIKNLKKILIGSLFVFVWMQTTAHATESCYAGSDITDELIFIVDRNDGTTATVVGPFGAANIEALGKDPATGVLYAADANQLGTVNLDTGAFTATSNTFGTALAANGDLAADVVLADVDSIGFDPATGFLYGVQNTGGDEILFRIDPATGALVPGAFGGNDYLLVSGVTNFDDIAIDNTGVMYASSATTLYTIDFSATGTVAAVSVGSFGGPNDMEGLSTDVPGALIGTTGNANADPADNNSIWDIDTAGGTASNQSVVGTGGDFEGVACYLSIVDLELDKTVVLTNDADGSTDITPGDTITYTLTVTNTDLNQLTSGVEITDNLFGLAGLSFVSFTTTKPNPGAPFPNPEYDSATGVWTVGTIPANTTYELDLVYTVTAAAASSSITNTAEITQSANPDPDSTPNNDDGDQSEDDEDNATIVVGAAPIFADLSLTKSIAPSAPSIGDTVTFTITVANDALSTAAATGVSVQDIVPAGYNNIANINNGGTEVSNVVTWTGLSIPIGGSVSLTFDADVTSVGVYTNTAQVTASDQQDLDSTPNNDDGDQSEDDEDNATITPPAGALVCPAGTTLMSSSGNADSQTNTGVATPNEALGAPDGIGAAPGGGNSAELAQGDSLTLNLTDLVPEGGEITISIARTGQNNNNSVDIATSDGTGFTATTNVVPNAGTLQTITYTVPYGSGGAQLIEFTFVGGGGSRRIWVDGVSYDEICDSVPTADLSITKDDGSLTYTPGGTGTYSIVVTNNGPDDVTAATIADTLPNGVTLSGPWSCAASGGSSCSAASGGAAGGSAVNLTADILNGGTITLTVPVSYSSNMGDY